MGLVERWRESRARKVQARNAARYASMRASLIGARRAAAERDDEVLVSVDRGIYRDEAGSYVFSAPRLLEIAQRCGSRAVDPRQVESLLRIATQIAMTADGVPLRLDRLTEADVDRRPTLRLVGPEVA